ncbi:MAG TPA: hypothetical protein VJ952_08215, partial [Opitutales bacterium]|nr:hypothetical protein [Opitutales bacterium]
MTSDPLPSREESSAFISLVPAAEDGDETGLIEQANLFDSAPLFIPGEWSAASKIFSSRILQEWQVFPGFEPSIELMAEVRPDRLALPRVARVQQPADLLDLRFWDLFSHFGQEDLPVDKPESWRSLALVTVLSG